MSVHENTIGCDHPLVSELEEHVGLGDVVINEPNVTIEEEGGCDQRGQQSSVWMLLGLALVSFARRFKKASPVL